MNLTQNKKNFLLPKPVITAVILCGLSGVGYYGYSSYSAGQMHQMPATVVEALKVEPTAVYPEAAFVAKIESMDKVGLRARVQGFLQQRLFKEGDIVKKDQPLFVIEKVNFEANVREAEANVAKAEAQVKNAKAQFDRAKTLYKTKDVSESKLDEAEAAYASAEASLGQAKAKLDLVRKDLEYTTIVAPMDGKIGEATYSVGELIGPESGVLAQVVAVNPIDAVFSVSENQLLNLQKNFQNAQGTSVQFVKADGVKYPEAGKINFVDVMLDDAMNTLKIKVSFPNPNNNLIAGQYGRVILKSLDARQELVVPMKAVQQDMVGTYVYIVNAENKIEKRDVVRGEELEGFNVVITSGLTSGDTIVTEGFQKIAPSAVVKPVFAQKGE